MEDWKPIMTSIFKKCYDHLTKKKAEIEAEFEKAPFNIKKSECNVFYMVFKMCFSDEMFVVSFISLQLKFKKLNFFYILFQSCPAARWTNTPACNKGKEWLKKCLESKRQIWMQFEDDVVKNGKSRRWIDKLDMNINWIKTYTNLPCFLVCLINIWGLSFLLFCVIWAEQLAIFLFTVHKLPNDMIWWLFNHKSHFLLHLLKWWWSCGVFATTTKCQSNRI